MESPLDKIEPYQLFKGTLLSKWCDVWPDASRAERTDACPEMQQEQPQFYASLAGHLSPEEQNMLQSIMVKADEVAAQQQAELEQQQQQLMAGQQAQAAVVTPAPR